MIKAEVDIRLKKGVVDPEGKNIAKALRLLDFNEVNAVVVSRRIEIVLNDTDKEFARRRVDEMCKKLLANPVINDYSITINDIYE